jgi:hypothetical protein
MWHVASVFLLLFAGRQLARACFRSGAACWGGVVLLAGTLSVPVAGTALVIMDPYVTARSLSTPLTMLAIASYVSNRRRSAVAWLGLTALVHPQMVVYGAVFLGCVWVTTRVRARAKEPVALEPVLFSALPFLYGLDPARGAAREALLSRTYFFIGNWAWYEWVGVFAPLALAWWCTSRKPRAATPAFDSLVRAMIPFGLLFTAAAAVPACFIRLENFVRWQPMRAFHVVYAIFFLLLGGLLGEYVLKNRAWRWLALFLPLAGSMYAVQRNNYPNSPHVEWPGYAYPNPWDAAFRWIRMNTPKDAVFALDPNYMLLAGEDQHGFRAVAERSVLADAVKDSGVVSLFPGVAGDWKRQVEAQSGLEQFGRRDLERLATLYPVHWILTWSPGPPGYPCPYRNEKLSVCRIDAAPAVHAPGVHRHGTS